MKFELHCHSCYSRGKKIPTEGIPRPDEIIRHAKSIGLSGIAITDHLTTEAWNSASKEAIRQGIVFIPGVELQTQSGHLIALGISEQVGNHLGFEESVEKIHETGGIAIAPHPFDIRGDGARELAFRADAVEIFNALSIDLVSNRRAASTFRNSGIPAIAGSDAHTLGMIGRAVNIMEADDVDSVLKCIRTGRVKFKADYMPMEEIITWTRERLSRSEDYMLGYICRNYSPPKAWLYGKLLKKFMATSNAPWKVLAEASLAAIRGYGIVKIMGY